MRVVSAALMLAVVLGPATVLGCEVIESDLYRINRAAIVEQPAPPVIMAVTAQASLSPAVAGGCSDDGCPDGSALTFNITLAPEDAGRFGYQIEFIDPPRHVPFISGVLAPLDPADPYAVSVLWGSNAQFQATVFQARLRTVNLKGEFGTWSAPIAVKPAPLDGQPAGFGLGSLSLLILLGLGRMRRRA
ncbi:MAG: hypothetical protein ACI9U2_001526 [Bradymonadia bacterium]|jgi:hypothetical protein